MQPPIDLPIAMSAATVAAAPRVGRRTDADQPLRAAVADAYRQHHGLVYHLALRYGRGRVAFAEDVTQEVFVQLLRHVGVLAARDELGGWLYVVATRRCLSKLRNERLLDVLSLGWLRRDDEPAHDGQAMYGAREELRRTFDALSRLPAKERIAFSMYHLDGRPQDEICAVLGHSKGYVSKLIQRATDALARHVGREVEP